ncbi:hypothetical protein V2J09_022506 [Rumex salicifolius]
MKKDCIKFKAWLEKKDNFRAYICYESNMDIVNHDKWWIGIRIHISNTLQGMANLRKPRKSERFIYSGNKIASHVEAVGTCSLILSNGFTLPLEKTFYVPKFARYMISFCRLVLFDSAFSIFKKYKVIVYGTLSDKCIMNEDFFTLWHRRFGHISIERIKRLVKEGVLSTLDFTDFDTCSSCIKGKQTNKHKVGAKRSYGYICCPDMNANDPKYFIPFIDDYSRYMFLYLLRSKDEALDVFKLFKAGVENQCGKRIKIVRSDRGGEYYGRYTENEQAPGPYSILDIDNF